MGEHTLKRSLGPVNLITLGIGAIIGAGIFVLTGQAAALHAGPCSGAQLYLCRHHLAFAGLCYSEFASIIPIAGSAYTYGYATLGSWWHGSSWDLGLNMLSAPLPWLPAGLATSSACYSNCTSTLPPQFTTTYGNMLYFLWSTKWQPATSLPSTVNLATLPHSAGVFNFVAFFAILIVIYGAGHRHQGVSQPQFSYRDREADHCGHLPGSGRRGYLFHHPELARVNWHPFIPPAEGPGKLGVLEASPLGRLLYSSPTLALTLFRPPRKKRRATRSATCPIGILWVHWWFAPCLYILVSTVLTGLGEATAASM